MKFRINYGNEISAVPLSAVNANADELTLKILILICSDPCLRDDEAAAQRVCRLLSCSEAKFREAVSFWKGAGIILNENEFQSKAQSPEPESVKPEDNNAPVLRQRSESPSYTGEQLADLLENEETGLKDLISECQNVMGKILNPAEISRIAALTDYLGLKTEQVLMMFVYYKKKFDESGKKLSVPYIEKTAYALYEDGIDTPEKFEEFMRRTEERGNLNGRLRRLFGVGDRTFTKKESSIINSWVDDLGMTYEMIEHAYECNIDNIGKLSLSYMTKILTNWRDAGITTVEAAEAAESAYKSSKESSETNSGSFDTDDFFEKALRRSYDEMKKAE